MIGYIAQGNVNIRIHRDITGEMQFGVGQTRTLKVMQITEVGR